MMNDILTEKSIKFNVMEIYKKDGGNKSIPFLAEEYGMQTIEAVSIFLL